jgi:cell division protein FtsI (penicillin-binding protein 3)
LVNLSRVLKVNPHELRKKLISKKSFVWVKRKVPPEQAEKIRKLKIEGIDLIRETKRFYPNRELAGHVLGFAGLDSRGLEGVELYYDDYLRGKPCHFMVEKDGVGRNLSSEKNGEELSDGCSLVLTLDKGIQYIVEKRLRESARRIRAKSRIVIVMGTQTGEILAIANQPEFNPNTFWSYRPSSFRNRAVTDAFEPGSTFKSFLLAGAIEEKVAKENELFFCENGSYEFQNKIIHDVKKHGWLSLREVIELSSNIGATKVGEKLGREKYYKYIRDFGFGERTGVDLPGERKGLIRPVNSWSEVAIGTASFGQGITVTGLQLISAFSAIANGGNLMKPYLVKELLDQRGQTTKTFHPQVVRRVISEQTARRVTSLLKGVVEEGGTGSRAKIAGYEVAGKTGTAQKVDPKTRKYSKDKFISSFIGFVPADSPRLTILVVIDEPEGQPYGGTVAAPLFKDIASEILLYLGLPPKLEVVKEEKKSPSLARQVNLLSSHSVFDEKERRPQEGKGMFFPDFAGMTIRQVLKLTESMGIDIEIIGSGKAVDQNPRPGTLLKTGDKSQVKFQPSSA